MTLISSSLYPAFGVGMLRSQRDQRWAKLVDSIGTLPTSDPRSIAFTLTMRRLRRRGNLDQHLCRDPSCAICATHVVASFEGNEQELVDFYYNNLNEINHTRNTMPIRRIVRIQRFSAA